MLLDSVKLGGMTLNRKIRIFRIVSKKDKQGLAEVSNAIYEQALNGSTGAACFFLKNRDPDRWSDVKSVNAVQINVGKMTDTQLLEELRSDSRVYAAITRQMPELEKITSTVEED